MKQNNTQCTNVHHHSFFFKYIYLLLRRMFGLFGTVRYVFCYRHKSVSEMKQQFLIIKRLTSFVSLYVIV